MSPHHPEPFTDHQSLDTASIIGPVLLSFQLGRHVRTRRNDKAWYWLDGEGLSAVTNGVCEAARPSAYWERLADRGLPVTEAVGRLLIGRLHHGSARQNRGVEAGSMLLFCPGCGNGLIVEEGQRCHRFACNTCPYVHNITRKVSSTDPCLLCYLGGSASVGALRSSCRWLAFVLSLRRYPKSNCRCSSGVAPATSKPFFFFSLSSL